MRQATRRTLLAIVLALSLGSGGCPAPRPAVDGGEPDAGLSACEAVDTEHLELLNATTGSTVVSKTPAHPPLDGGLP